MQKREYTFDAWADRPNNETWLTAFQNSQSIVLLNTFRIHCELHSAAIYAFSIRSFRFDSVASYRFRLRPIIPHNARDVDVIFFADIGGKSTINHVLAVACALPWLVAELLNRMKGREFGYCVRNDV